MRALSPVARARLDGFPVETPWKIIRAHGTVSVMASSVHHVTIDCADTYRLATFWAEVLAGKIGDDDLPGDPEALVEADGVSLLFVAVPEGRAVKNRIHFDIQPTDRGRDEEVERLLALGATLVADRRRPDGSGWATLADIEGNEFCVERSAAERAAATTTTTATATAV
ncbi:VOC family protein [Streptomyces goshikiensis]|uniref:VOC family protein n=2 Tax=Streptomyces goshikiensis TaxID=1942 RepID=UPI0036A01139